MSIIEAIILGVVQGLTEFLPVSSTAHLTLIGKAFGLVDPSNPEHWTAFIAVTQLGTLAAVLMYFLKEIIIIPKDFFVDNISSRKPFMQQSAASKTGWLIIIGTIPIVVIGFLLKKIIEGEITKDPIVIATSLIVLAVVLAFAEKTARFARKQSDLGIKDALILGLAQCLAVIPGASRSGVTLTAGLFLGMKREEAARFSFLLSIPAVFASGIYEFYKSLGYINPSEMLTTAIAVIVAFISGWATIAFLLNFLKKHTTGVFIIYRLILGAAILTFALKGLI